MENFIGLFNGKVMMLGKIETESYSSASEVFPHDNWKAKITYEPSTDSKEGHKTIRLDIEGELFPRQNAPPNRYRQTKRFRLTGQPYPTLTEFGTKG